MVDMAGDGGPWAGLGRLVAPVAGAWKPYGQVARLFNSGVLALMLGAGAAGAAKGNGTVARTVPVSPVGASVSGQASSEQYILD